MSVPHDCSGCPATAPPGRFPKGWTEFLLPKLKLHLCPRCRADLLMFMPDVVLSWKRSIIQTRRAA